MRKFHLCKAQVNVRSTGPVLFYGHPPLVSPKLQQAGTYYIFFCSVVLNISKSSRYLVYGCNEFSGGFSWRLDFFWEWLPPRDRARRLRDPTTSYKTPAMAGGLFAINREWFLELGAYDTQMDVSGTLIP